jgi:hypothetical protein
VLGLAAQNRGGDIGATNEDYALRVHYHYMAGSLNYPEAFDPNPIVPSGAFVPDFVDGIKVVAVITNPTTFAKALPLPIDDIVVGAASAMALSPTCRPAPPSEPGTTLPFTRYRYSFERELPAKANDLCSPFIFWSGQSDVDGPGNNAIKNKISFNTRSFYIDENPQSVPPSTEQQLLTGFDHRNNGSGDPPVPTGVDMRGSAANGGTAATDDVSDWIYYQWLGTILTNTSRVGDPAVLGDWAEIYATGDHGENVQSPLLHQIQNAPDGGYTSISAPWPNGLNWGRAITRTVYLWGDGLLPSSTSAQAAEESEVCRILPCNCNANPELCDRVVTWEDVLIRQPNGQHNRIWANGDFQRVRFTDAVQIVFYENINGGFGQALCPDGTNMQIPNNSSEARGILPSTLLPGPPPGGDDACPPGWTPGDGVYFRRIAP